jgi:hypothetical protein
VALLGLGLPGTLTIRVSGGDVGLLEPQAAARKIATIATIKIRPGRAPAVPIEVHHAPIPRQVG